MLNGSVKQEVLPRFPPAQKAFLLSKVHTGSDAHAVSYSMDIRSTTPRGKALHFAEPVQPVDVEGLQSFPFFTA
jgi:hypothetical protein